MVMWNLSEDGLRRADDMKVSWNDLRQIRNTLGAETLEDESDRLDDGPMVLGQ